MSRPAISIYHVREGRKGQADLWRCIGAAWPHANGDGFNIEIDALPLNFTGKLVALANKADAQKGGEA